MELGEFSVSLNVKDIKSSKLFHEKLGFQVFGGNFDQNWLIMKNPNCTIGLFQGMLEKNSLTFNPGWDDNATKLEAFTDIRGLQKQFKSKNVEFTTEIDKESSGSASFIVIDPDGNPILFDQHV